MVWSLEGKWVIVFVKQYEKNGRYIETDDIKLFKQLFNFPFLVSPSQLRKRKSVPKNN